MNLWIASIAIFCIGSLLGALNFITTLLNMRTRGMSLMRMPLTCWAWFTTAVTPCGNTGLSATRKTSVVVAPAGSAPNAQLTLETGFPVVVHAGEQLAATKTVFAGMASETTTPAAGPEPVLVYVSWYSRVSPGLAAIGPAANAPDVVTSRSALVTPDVAGAATLVVTVFDDPPGSPVAVQVAWLEMALLLAGNWLFTVVRNRLLNFVRRQAGRHAAPQYTPPWTFRCNDGRFISATQAVRRDGSAALDLAYVAAGRFDGFWEGHLSPWDMAAGMLLVREAGGKTTDYDGRPHSWEHRDLVASNARIHEAMLEIIAGNN